MDVFEYFEDQLRAISMSLKQEKLIEFVKRMMEQLLGLLRSIVSASLEEESRPLLLVIRLNDLTSVAQEFAKFKDSVIAAVGKEYTDRLDIVLDKDMREMVEQATAQAELVAVSIARGSLQEDLLLHFFTVTWQKDHGELLEELLASAAAALKETLRPVAEERFANKAAEALYTLLALAYVERFLIAVNMRYKLKLPIERPLLRLVYEDSLLPKTSPKKRVLKTHLVDFYGKTCNIDQEIFEIVQADIRLFAEVAEMPRVAWAVSVLSLVSQMVNAHNEEEFAAFEEQFWTLLRAQEDPKVIVVAPGGVHIDGQQLIRACRKIKTRNGR